MPEYRIIFTDSRDDDSQSERYVKADDVNTYKDGQFIVFESAFGRDVRVVLMVRSENVREVQLIDE